MNVDFSNAGKLPNGLGGLKLCNSGPSLDGKTVQEILGIANTALGGGRLPSGYTISQLNVLVNNLNKAFVGGTSSIWAKTHLC